MIGVIANNIIIIIIISITINNKWCDVAMSTLFAVKSQKPSRTGTLIAIVGESGACASVLTGC